ncbi:unnamed protein product [marine sediment metagenome]|uniref:Uncharacterized protein n=1 Tax=marine sediment metagenome TaxID=412755 RepID=X1RQY3_9ZZZZ
MTATDELKKSIERLKKDTDERIKRLKIGVKEVEQTRQEQTGQQYRQR